MAITDQNINLIPNEPDLSTLLDYFQKSLKIEFACHHIGTIQSFDPDTQTATASLAYQKTKNNTEGVGNATVQAQNYPILIDCPVICLGGGSGAITFPITVGDECLILFNDRDFGNWFAGNSSSPPPSSRLHSFADGIILVGVRSMASVLTDYDSSAVTLKLGENNIKIMEDSVAITLSSGTTLTLRNDGTFSVDNATAEIVFAIYKLFVDIQNATVTTLLGPQPLIMPTYEDDLADLETFVS